jgi:hypothetical protein
VGRMKIFLNVKSEGKIKGGIEVTGRRGRRRRKLLNDLKERRGESSGLHYVERLLWKRFWTCRKTDYIMNIKSGGTYSKRQASEF